MRIRNRKIKMVLFTNLELFPSVEVSPPPIQGDMWFKETCSINDVPYFLKYHHSKIKMSPEIKDDVPVRAT